ncbi:MAG: hypothetical protein IJK89_06420 [Clostridia bacterium]|nr:hypothetical protein [Clostridia bacterium]
MKKAIFVLLMFCLLGSALTPCAMAREAEIGPYVMSSAPAVADFIFSSEFRGELQFAPATLETAEGSQEVWIVALMGINFYTRNSNNLFSYLHAAFNTRGRYFNRAKEGLLQNVPEGAKLVLAGHSLGGMIAQQLMCAEEITSRYEVLNTLTFGSPYVVVDTDKREGRLVRLEEQYDIIPKFSVAFLLAPDDYKGAIKRAGPYSGDTDAAHNRSYRNMDVWGGFDALGTENGAAKLVLDRDAVASMRA